GVGLAICSRLCRLMDGRIGLDSGENEGSTFWFEVPFTRPPGGDSEDQPLPPAGARLLVITRTGLARTALVDVLRDAGLEAQGAQSGSEALDLLYGAHQRQAPFDLILVDHQLPDMSGPELASIIRHSADLEPAPLMLLSRVGEKAADPTLDEDHFAARLTKPVRRRQLLESLDQLLRATPPDTASE
ncbi:response regulator, partial [Myxococcota bacterium]